MSYTNYNPMTMIKYLTSDDGKRFRVYDMTIDKGLYVTDTYKFECYPLDGISLLNATYPFEIKKVIYNDPATIVLWTDGTKTVVKCQEDDIYDEQTGLLMCIAKKAYGNTGEFNNVLREWEPKVEEVIFQLPNISFEHLNQAVVNAFENFTKLRNTTEDERRKMYKEGFKASWTPCSERLPEKSGEYLISYRLFDGDIQTRTDVFVGGEWGNEYVDHIAWMPLPEPYKAEQNE